MLFWTSWTKAEYKYNTYTGCPRLAPCANHAIPHSPPLLTPLLPLIAFCWVAHVVPAGGDQRQHGRNGEKTHFCLGHLASGMLTGRDGMRSKHSTELGAWGDCLSSPRGQAAPEYIHLCILIPFLNLYEVAVYMFSKFHDFILSTRFGIWVCTLQILSSIQTFRVILTQAYHISVSHLAKFFW